jgi:hypothetical protein
MDLGESEVGPWGYVCVWWRREESNLWVVVYQTTGVAVCLLLRVMGAGDLEPPAAASTSKIIRHESPLFFPRPGLPLPGRLLCLFSGYIHSTLVPVGQDRDCSLGTPHPFLSAPCLYRQRIFPGVHSEDDVGPVHLQDFVGVGLGGHLLKLRPQSVCLGRPSRQSQAWSRCLVC